MHQLGTKTQVPCCTALTFASYSWLYPDKSITAAQAFTAIALLNMVQAIAAGGMGGETTGMQSHLMLRGATFGCSKLGGKIHHFNRKPLDFRAPNLGQQIYLQGLPIFPNLWAADFHLLSCDQEWQQRLDTNEDTFLTNEAHTHSNGKEGNIVPSNHFGYRKGNQNQSDIDN